MSERAKDTQSSRRQRAADHYIDHPVHFVEDFFGVTPDPWQCDLLETVAESKRTAVRSCHGAGKTTVMAWVSHWYFHTRPYCVIPQIAPTFGKQTKEIFWNQIALWYQKLPTKDLINLDRTRMSWKGKEQTWFMAGIAAGKANDLEGFHGAEQYGGHLLYVVEEAKGIEQEIWDAIEGALTTPNAKVLAGSVPGAPVGQFYNIFTKFRDRWRCFIVHPLALKEELGRPERNGTYYSPRVPQAYVDDGKANWGVDNPIYQAKVIGDFPQEEEGTLVPLAWIERAMKLELPMGPTVSMAVDVARFGDDESVQAVRRGQVIEPLRGIRKHDTMAVAGWIKASWQQLGVDEGLIVDVVGIGSGVVDRLVEQQLPCYGLNVGEAAHDPEHFVNRRAELYWMLRTDLEHTRLALPFDEVLMGQLAGLKYKYTSDGKIKIESKEEMKKRGIASPDRPDAIMMTYARGQVVTVQQMQHDVVLVPRITSTEMDW